VYRAEIVIHDKRKSGLSADDKPVAMLNCAFRTILAHFQPVSAHITSPAYCVHALAVHATSASVGKTSPRMQKI